MCVSFFFQLQHIIAYNSQALATAATIDAACGSLNEVYERNDVQFYIKIPKLFINVYEAEIQFSNLQIGESSQSPRFLYPHLSYPHTQEHTHTLS